MRPTDMRQTLSRIVAAALCVAVVSGAPAGAVAAVLDSDLVGGRTANSSASLRRNAPDLYVPAGMLTTMDGRELWARDPDGRRAMASTTKIMTAVVVLENADLDEVVTVGAKSAKVGESAMGLVPGERFTVRELLKGVLVQSGNDAATLIATHVGGSAPAFVGMMNAKAAQLDLVNTRYVNAHGLDAKGHYTSPEDLTALTRYAMRIPEFRAIVRTYRLKLVSDRYTHVLQSHNTLLKTYHGAEGVKTGWTDDAGYCVVSAAKRSNTELVATIMGASSETGRAQQAKTLLDWGFRHYRATTVAEGGEHAGRVKVTDYLDRTVAARVLETTAVPVFDLAGRVERRIRLRDGVRAPVAVGDVIGTMTIHQGGTVLAQVPLIADSDVPVPTPWQRIVFFFGRLWRGIFGA